MLYKELFYKLAYVSIKASFLIIVIIFVKHLFGKKIGVKAQYYLWFLLLIKLSLFTNVINIRLLNIFDKFTEGLNIASKEYVYMPEEIIDWFNGAVDKNVFDKSPIIINTTNKLHSFNNIIPTIWVAISSLLILYMVISNTIVRNKINSSKIIVDDNIQKILQQCKQRLNLKTDIKIYKSSVVNTPCLFGLLKPCILIPKDIEKNIHISEMKYIITHELAHYKRKDIFVFYMIAALKIVYCFNPFIWYGFYRMRQDCEIACDALALSTFKDNENQKYGLSLIHLMENNIGISNNMIIARFINSKKYTKRRIRMIKLFKKGSYKISFTAAAIFLLIGVIFFTNSHAQKNAINVHNKSNQTGVDNKDTTIVQQEKFDWPVPNNYSITSTYGKRIHPITREEIMHTGIDIIAKKGEKIIAVGSGKVIFAGEKEKYGKIVIIDHGNGIATMYGHCSEITVNKDDKVDKGVEIAKVGMSGFSTGPHLHFEIRKNGETVNPLDYINN